MTPNQTQLHEAHMKVLYLGLILNLALPVVMLLVGYMVRQYIQAGEMSTPDAPSRIFYYGLLFVAASELPVALFLKKLMLKPLPLDSTSSVSVPTTGFVSSRYLILFNLGAACSVYGFVWFMLGGTFTEFVLFAVIGLIMFRFVRPSQDFFFSLFGVRPAIE